MPEFIFMLTKDDRTVDNALEVLAQVRETGLRHIGFKDVGAPLEQQKQLVFAAREAGMTSYLEIVSVSREDELASVDRAIASGVDWVLGGKFVRDAVDRLAGTGIKLAPFPGTVVGHPSQLRGSIEEIVASAVEITALDGVTGVDLLAYRHGGVDPLELTSAVVQAVEGPVITAGSVTTEQQIDGLARAGAWGFTIGGAIFDGALPGAKDVVSQVRTALRCAATR